MLAMLCHPDKGGREDLFKIILQKKKITEDEDARNIYDKYGIEKAEEYKNSKMDLWHSCLWVSGTLKFSEGGRLLNHRI